MKVDSSGSLLKLTGENPAVSRNARPSQAGPGPARDSVTLSSVSGQIQALEVSLGEAGDFDAARVEAIRLAISEGRFTIDPEAVADKLIASTRELLAQQKG